MSVPSAREGVARVHCLPARSLSFVLQRVDAAERGGEAIVVTDQAELRRFYTLAQLLVSTAGKRANCYDSVISASRTSVIFFSIASRHVRCSEINYDGTHAIPPPSLPPPHASLERCFPKRLTAPQMLQGPKSTKHDSNA